MGGLIAFAILAVLVIVGAWIWALNRCGFFDQHPDDKEQP